MERCGRDCIWFAQMCEDAESARDSAIAGDHAQAEHFWSFARDAHTAWRACEAGEDGTGILLAIKEAN